MGIFDGCLICSDLDGTFDYNNARNLEALEYYKQNGGLFSFCTGRSELNIYEFGLDKYANAPVCLCNGALVFDFCKKEVLFEKRLPCKAKDIIEPLKQWAADVNHFYLPTTGMEYVYAEALTETIYDITALKFVWNFKDEQKAKAFMAEATQKFDNLFVSSSWSKGVEFTDINATKGHGIQFIKKVTGAKIAYGIGDNNNDITLLDGADVGVAVGNAIPELKAHADMTVCHFEQGAIADLIYKIEENIKNA